MRLGQSGGPGSGRRTGENASASRRIDLFLLGWLLIELLGCYAIWTFLASRHVFRLATVLLLVCGRLAAASPSRGGDRRLLGWVVAWGVGVGLLFFAADLSDALARRDAVRRAADQLVALGADRERESVWYAGHWGFQFYAESLGMKPVVPGDSRLEAGDWLLVPDGVSRQHFWIPANRVTREALVESRSPWPWSSIPSFYAGPIPLRSQPEAQLVVRVYRVQQGFQATSPTRRRSRATRVPRGLGEQIRAGVSLRMSARPSPIDWTFWSCAVGAMGLHALLVFSAPELRGGADLLPHLRLVQLMGEAPALRNVYAPAYHALGALVSPLTGIILYQKVFTLAAAAIWIAAFRFFQRAADLPSASSALFALAPYSFALSSCPPKVEVLGYALAFLALGLLARRRYAAVAAVVATTFWVHTASALFLGIAGGVFALASRDLRGTGRAGGGKPGCRPAARGPPDGRLYTVTGPHVLQERLSARHGGLEQRPGLGCDLHPRQPHRRHPGDPGRTTPVAAQPITRRDLHGARRALSERAAGWRGSRHEPRSTCFAVSRCWPSRWRSRGASPCGRGLGRFPGLSRSARSGPSAASVWVVPPDLHYPGVQPE